MLKNENLAFVVKIVEEIVKAIHYTEEVSYIVRACDTTRSICQFRQVEQRKRRNRVANFKVLYMRKQIQVVKQLSWQLKHSETLNMGFEKYLIFSMFIVIYKLLRFEKYTVN